MGKKTITDNSHEESSLNKDKMKRIKNSFRAKQYRID